ncbi:uncharacterized protein LOC123684566 [Harmonia axyridis]|uniref:uncharacterized protein LOC123684566 n=1 Tax=Harmonia axyridis TaxID=115357 RepID=UPI001E2786DD|nr:uncharacterized protein LOC123684566 [Harmonia axyridis]
MAGKRFIIVLLWMCLLLQSDCYAKERVSKRELAQDRIHLQRSQPYVKEEPGFLSRIASWIFPFGSSKSEADSIPSAGHHSPSYLPPPKQPHPKYLPTENLPPQNYPPAKHESSDCNPCNREPWIPIPGKSERNNVINFVPPNEVNKVVLDGLNPPPPQYGAPKPLPNSINAITSFDRPPVHQELPKVEYGPPSNSPSPQYGVPNIEITPSVLFGSLVIPQNSGPSLNQYVPVGSGPSLNQYVPVGNFRNAPETPSTFPQVPKGYGPPFRTKVSPVPSPHSGVPNHMLPPPSKVLQQGNYINIVGMRPPPPPRVTTHLVPVKQHHQNPNSIQDILQPPVSQHSVLDEEYPPYTSKPIDFYSTPDIHGIEQIPLSSGDNDDAGYPIAFPNLSIRPLVPLHNYVPFRRGYGGSEKVESVQILQSVPIADYVSSIEHPINVIQSPIVDLSLGNEPESTKLININEQSKPTVYTSDHVSSRPNTIQSGIFVNPNIERVKFNENPIVVDDVQTAASSHNETYQKSDQSSNRDGGEDIGVQSLETSTLPLSGREEFDDINSIKQEFSDNIKSTFDKKEASKELKFTEPPLDFSEWTPTWGGISMEMTPPSVQSSWTTTFDSTETPKKPKHIQIIIPYYSFNGTTKHVINDKIYTKNVFPHVKNPKKEVYTTLLPVYTPPPSSEHSLWSQFLNNFDNLPSGSAEASAFRTRSSTSAYNIQDLLGGDKPQIPQDLPFDILTFQKNIDEWTQQAYSKTTEKLTSGQGVIQKLNPSKRIPDQYLTTVPYDYTTIQPLNNFIGDQEPAGSVNKENFRDDVGNELILNEATTTTEELSTVTPVTEINTDKEIKTTLSDKKEKKSLWESAEVTISGDTKEKVYIVTPGSPVAWSSPPKILKETTTTESNLLFEHPKFSIRIEDNNTNSSKNANGTTKVIFSEWPHKINNLQTTTPKHTSRHPLFGRMDVSAYNPPSNKIIANVNGHSRILQDLASFVEEQKNSSTTK